MKRRLPRKLKKRLRKHAEQDRKDQRLIESRRNEEPLNPEEVAYIRLIIHEGWKINPAAEFGFSTP
jgi:hypothetical protein